MSRARGPHFRYALGIGRCQPAVRRGITEGPRGVVSENLVASHDDLTRTDLRRIFKHCSSFRRLALVARMEGPLAAPQEKAPARRSGAAAIWPGGGASSRSERDAGSTRGRQSPIKSEEKP